MKPVGRLDAVGGDDVALTDVVDDRAVGDHGHAVPTHVRPQRIHPAQRTSSHEDHVDTGPISSGQHLSGVSAYARAPRRDEGSIQIDCHHHASESIALMPTCPHLTKKAHVRQYGPMPDRDALERTLHRIDGKGYGSYQQLQGTYDFGRFRLAIDKVQVDPYAPPSLMRVIIDSSTAGLPADLVSDARGRVAVADFLTRGFDQNLRRDDGGSSGTGPDTGSNTRSAVSIGHPGQEVLERTSVRITDHQVQARISVGMPAAGRRVRGRQAAQILIQQLPQIVDASLLHAHLAQDRLRQHVTLYRDQEYVRHHLGEAGLVTFVGDGAILPRRSGDSDSPLEHGGVPFQSPDSLRVEFELPSGRTVTGMGIPEGVTVIVGGGYHGKSTLLRAIERGVYAHIGGDGREWVITRGDAASIRAEDGRAVTGVDISAFIAGLPSGADTADFSTTNASGSTSQAANLAEAVEAGASAVLIDEDTSATNFMIRDERMRQLIAADREPITPFIDRVRPLFTEQGVSTIVVAGGSGAFFDVADHVIALDAYVPQDVTARARQIAGRSRLDEPGPGPVFGPTRDRVPASGGLQSPQKTKPAKARGRSIIHYGKETVGLSAVVQLVDAAQTEALAHALDRLASRADGRTGLIELVEQLLGDVDEHGLDVLSPHRGHPGHLARPRAHELHAAVNRYRGLRLA